MSLKRNDSQLQRARPARNLEQMHEHSEDAARLLKALANGNRLMILCLLYEGPRSVSQLNEVLPLSQSALSQHLAVLREEGLVSTKREAQTILYRIVSRQARRVVETLHGIYCGSK